MLYSCRFSFLLFSITEFTGEEVGQAHSRHHSPFCSSKPAGPWHEKRRALETKDSRTSGLRVGSPDTSIHCVGVRDFFCFKQAIKIVLIHLKIPEPFVSRAKGYGDENKTRLFDVTHVVVN